MASVKWVPVNDFPNYIIHTKYPYEIYKFGKTKPVKEWTRPDGYVTLHLDGKTVYKHIIVAKQFIPNPNKYSQVDHIDTNTSNFHHENLRWVSNMQNCNNKRGDTLVDSLPDEAIMVETFNDWTFTDLYYHDNTFYRYNGIKYKVMKNQRKNNNSTYFIRAFDDDGVQRTIYFTRFKREYDL